MAKFEKQKEVALAKIAGFDQDFENILQIMKRFDPLTEEEYKERVVTNLAPSSPGRKLLVLDMDETLIHVNASKLGDSPTETNMS